jgi:hypothetical protein
VQSVTAQFDDAEGCRRIHAGRGPRRVKFMIQLVSQVCS